MTERGRPAPRRLRGQLHLQPGALPARAFALDEAGCHVWQPISPVARVQVAFDTPGLSWQGEAYLDANQGERPLARDFDRWHWQRSTLPGRRSQLLYEVSPRQPGADARPHALALLMDANGQISPLPLPPRQVLASSGWGLARASRGQATPALLATLESGPFYCRSLLRDADSGALCMHESLSLQRFERPWVQALLPFRMPRRGGWGDR